MQRLSTVNRWTVLEEKQSLEFKNDKERNVRLQVNSAQEVELWYVCQATGETFFLALVKGLDVIDFFCIGPFSITVKGGFVQIFTNDGDDVSLAPTAEAAFVKVMERQRRNPELEYIVWKMEQNQKRNLEAQAHELQQLFERRLADYEATAAQSGGAGSVGDPAPQPPPPAGGAPAPDGAAEDDGGEGV